MAMGSGLLALTMALVAADGPPGPTVEATTYQVRVLTLDGLDWRTKSYSRLTPVARQGMSMVWTADKALAASLADRARPDAPCHTIMAVGEASLTKAEAVNYVGSMDRVADGPVNQSSAIAFMPRPEQVEERFSIKVEGRKLDQGILTRISMEESHVDVIHGVPQSETLVPPAAKAAKNSHGMGEDVRNFILAAIPSIPQATSITSSVQIPEVTRASICGEWLIPNDGVLIVSLGVKTAADDKGMAVARERVAVIEACMTTTSPDGRKSMITSPVEGPFRHVKLSQPTVPGRSMPEAVDPDGNLVDLPPLPEALASADLDRIKPDQPSPQDLIRSAPSVDPALARTNFDAVPAAPRVPVEVSDDSRGESIHLSEILDGLARAGVKVVVDVEAKDLAGLKSDCEKCEGDSTFCPGLVRSFKPGGIELAPGGPTKFGEINQPQLGIIVKDASGAKVADAGVKMQDVFKLPGKTETTLVPLGDRFSLEVKATLIPTSPDKDKPATAKAEAEGTTTRR